MPKSLPTPLPEVFRSTTATSRAVGQLVRAGRARAIGPRLYTSNVTAADEDIIRRNLWRVVALLVPGAVIGHRTAFEMRPAANGTVYLVGESRHVIELPGLRIMVLEGPGPQPGDTPFLDHLHLASRPRALLESLMPTRTRGGVSRGMPAAAIEEWLDRELRISGEGQINQLRDAARALAPTLGAERAFTRLDEMIGTLLGTRSQRLSSAVALARVAGAAYDPQRLELFQTLHAALVRWVTRPRPDVLPTDREFATIAFFDAYFSNYIEGTKFRVGEAREIVFEGVIPANRPRDAHDVLGTYQLVGDRAAMGRSVLDVGADAAFLEALSAAHARILSARPDKRPGQFKDKPNEAGNTTFVQPDLVRGTLHQGLQLVRSLSTPFARAAMLMFVLSEVHPFDDGNGRVSRAFMNAELVAGGQRRILIPIAFRNEYLTGLRTLSRQGHPDVFLEVLDYAQEYTARVDFAEYDTAEAALRATGAFEEATAQSQFAATLGGGAAEAPDVKLRMPPARDARPPEVA